MNCSCNEQTHKENQDGASSCGDGMKFDKDAGKCVKVGEKQSKEQLGDPKSTSTQGELPSGDAGGDQSNVGGNPCGPGESWDAKLNACAPTDRKDPGDGQTQGTDKTASVESSKILQELASLKAQIAGSNESKKPLAKVTDNSGFGGSRMEYKSLNEVKDLMLEALGNGQNFQFHIPLDFLRSVNIGNAAPSTGVAEAYRNTPMSIQEAYVKPNRLIKEAVAISGTAHATQDLDTDVAIVPGGISFLPVFQFAKVKQVPQGMDRARFFKSTIPANGSQTKGSAPSEATQTITAVEVTPTQITGVYLIGDYDEIENSPFDLLQSIVESSAMSYDDFVATEMLTTSVLQASVTTGLWIRGDTGATITSSDIATVELDLTGIAFAREYLENQGYLRGGIKPVLVVHPRQWRELILGADMTNLITRSAPDVWLKAQLEEVMGVQVAVSNAVESFTAQTNNAYNAIMFIPKHSFGIAVKRDVTVKFHDIGEENQIRVNTTWRTAVGVLDLTSIVRLSTTAP